MRRSATTNTSLDIESQSKNYVGESSNYKSECEHRDGFHFLAPDYLLIELIDSATEEQKEIADGEVGEFVYTSLQKEGQPLVRYRSGDIVKVVGTDRCECGLPLAVRATYIGECPGLFLAPSLHLLWEPWNE